MPNPALMDQLKDLTIRGSLIESRIPTGSARTIQCHEGGCYALAFDRLAFSKCCCSELG